MSKLISRRNPRGELTNPDSNEAIVVAKKNEEFELV